MMVDVVSYRRATGSSPCAWSKGRRPSGAVLHSSRELGVRRPCNDFMDMLRHLINCHIISLLLLLLYNLSTLPRNLARIRPLRVPMRSTNVGIGNVDT